MEISEKIVEIASEKFLKYGLRSVTIDDLCNILRISKKTFYVYFATKDVLVEAVLHRQEAEFEEKMVRDFEEMASVLDVLVANLQIVQRTKEILQPPPFLFDLQKYYPALFEQHKQTIFVGIQRHLHHFIQRGMDEKMFCADIDVHQTAMFLSYLHRGLLDALSHPDAEREEFTLICRHGLKLIMRGILTDEAKRLMDERMKNYTEK